MSTDLLEKPSPNKLGARVAHRHLRDLRDGRLRRHRPVLMALLILLMAAAIAIGHPKKFQRDDLLERQSRLETQSRVETVGPAGTLSNPR